MDDFARAYALAREVLPQLRPGSAPWCRVVGQMFVGGSQSGQHADLVQLGELFANTTPEVNAATLYIEAAAFLAGMSTWFGQREAAAAMLRHMETIWTTLRVRDGRARGWMCLTSGFCAHWLEARPWYVRAMGEEGIQAFSEMGIEHKSSGQIILGLGLAALGDRPGAIGALREGLASAQQVGQANVITEMHLALVLADSSDTAHQEEAQALAHQVLEIEQVNPLRLGNAQTALAAVATHRGQLSEAETWSRQACETLSRFLPYQLMAYTLLCATLTKQGRPSEARTLAEAGVRVHERMGGAGATSVGIWLAVAEACLAQGDVTAGEDALRRAVQCLLLRAEDIPDAVARERFLSQVPHNARTRELASQRWGERWAQPHF
jgi:eukaryotic-like serine/threonine-protein kinase